MSFDRPLALLFARRPSRDRRGVRRPSEAPAALRGLLPERRRPPRGRAPDVLVAGSTLTAGLVVVVLALLCVSVAASASSGTIGPRRERDGRPGRRHVALDALARRRADAARRGQAAAAVVPRPRTRQAACRARHLRGRRDRGRVAHARPRAAAALRRRDHAVPGRRRHRDRRRAGACRRAGAGGVRRAGDGRRRPPVRSPAATVRSTILFLSDGRQNRGLIPAAEGAALAAGAGIPVYTVALGTDRPDAGSAGYGRLRSASTAPLTGRRSARSRATTGGEYFAARSAPRAVVGVRRARLASRARGAAAPR